MPMSFLRHEDKRRWGCWNVNPKCVYAYVYAFVRDRQDRLTCRTCRCAHHWLGRNDREVGQPLECLVVRRVASQRRAAFSSLAYYDSFVGILTFRALLLSLFPLLHTLLALLPSRPLFIFHRPRDPDGNRPSFDKLCTWNAHIHFGLI